ncbi:MAG: hypothetical protein R2865_03045 [Deinococcales bacterium]
MLTILKGHFRVIAALDIGSKKASEEGAAPNGTKRAVFLATGLGYGVTKRKFIGHLGGDCALPDGHKLRLKPI